MPDNLVFFKNNVDYYSDCYRNDELKPWERRITELVSGPNVLDVACGGGRVARAILKRGINVTGTDFVWEFESKIRRHQSDFKGVFRFEEAHMTKLPFADKSFDSVICVNAIVYLKDLAEIHQAIHEMCRVLKPSGKLYITSWSLFNPLWGTSVLLNFLLGRSKTFGETHPFYAMDRNLKKSQTHMFVPSRKALELICQEEGVICSIYSGHEFARDTRFPNPFHPIIVLAGIKR